MPPANSACFAVDRYFGPYAGVFHANAWSHERTTVPSTLAAFSCATVALVPMPTISGWLPGTAKPRKPSE